MFLKFCLLFKNFICASYFLQNILKLFNIQADGDPTEEDDRYRR